MIQETQRTLQDKNTQNCQFQGEVARIYALHEAPYPERRARRIDDPTQAHNQPNIEEIIRAQIVNYKWIHASPNLSLSRGYQACWCLPIFWGNLDGSSDKEINHPILQTLYGD